MYYIYPSEADRRHRHPTGTQVEKFRNEKVHLMWRAHVTGESDSTPSVCTHPGQRLACWLSPRQRGWWRCTPMHLGGLLSQAAGEGSHWVQWSRMCDASGRPVKNTKDSQIWTDALQICPNIQWSWGGKVNRTNSFFFFYRCFKS